MQYPVLPWILADYTSTTLGALNEERLTFFKDRYAEMSGRKFLYGTHYSAPGYVLYYLVRTAPEYLLCLQNGRFDHPNRLFHSVSRTWDNVLTDHADVKELIPEFYQPPGDFLLNFQGLNLGIRSDGDRVNDVILPPWAKNAREFTSKCLESLECEYVSERLHNWIDLIFGYKQQGTEAMKANNLFHYLTYESSAAVDHQFLDPAMKAAIELQIKEFGQTPKQLFKEPHPKRRTNSDPKPPEPKIETERELSRELSSTASIGSFSEDWVFVQTDEAPPLEDISKGIASTCSGLKLRKMQKIHKDIISCVRLSHDCKSVYTVSHDKLLKVHGVNDVSMIGSFSISSLPLSSMTVLPSTRTVAVGSWDNNVYLYSIEYASIIDSCYAHDSSVTCVCYKNGRLVTGSWDSTVKVWDFPYDKNSSGKPPPPNMIAELDHDNEVTSLDINNDVTLVASGVSDGYLAVWDIEHEAKEFEFKAHDNDVLSVTFSPDGSSVCTTGADGFIKLFSVKERSESIAVKREEAYCCVVWLQSQLLAGGMNGSLSLLDSNTLNIISTIKNHTDAITSIDVSLNDNIVVTGGKDKCLGKVTNCFHFFSSDTILSSCLYLCTTEIHEYVIFSLLPW
uniref:BEACH domain-containing protein n=1 Tax=Amphimedon queenslandica TaxID=400682 RepID=A0A1X7UAC0_AMPQE